MLRGDLLYCSITQQDIDQAIANPEYSPVFQVCKREIIALGGTLICIDGRKALVTWDEWNQYEMTYNIVGAGEFSRALRATRKGAKLAKAVGQCAAVMFGLKPTKFYVDLTY